MILVLPVIFREMRILFPVKRDWDLPISFTTLYGLSTETAGSYCRIRIEIAYMKKTVCNSLIGAKNSQ